MSKEMLISVFKHFADFDAAEETLVKSLFTTIHVPAKSFLLQAGEVSHSLYFMVKGCARIGIDTPHGEDISCYFAQEMGWIAVYESFLTSTPSKYFIQTLEDCEMLVSDRLGVDTLFSKVRQGNLIGRKLTEGLFLQTVDRLTDFYVYTPEERFQRFLEAHPKLASRIPQSCVASYIGVKPQSLSRIKKRIYSES